MAIDPATAKLILSAANSKAGKKIIKGVFIYLPLVVCLSVSLVVSAVMSPQAPEINDFLEQSTGESFNIFTAIRDTWFPPPPPPEGEGADGSGGGNPSSGNPSNDNSSSDSQTPPPSQDGFLWPVPRHSGISSYYGWRTMWGKREFHLGIDVPAPSGTPIVATKAGTVTVSRWVEGYGNAVFIDHGGGYSSRYAHAVQLYVSPGDRVSQGQTIAGVGTTGPSTGNHLHFEIRVNGNTQDPIGYLR